MHAYLIVGSNEKAVQEEITKIAADQIIDIVNFDISKIDEVRQLQRFVKLKVAKRTAIIVPNIDTATTEALNAFLKNLEEPQENIKYILTATKLNNVLPTIISRCHVIKTKSDHKASPARIQKFLKLSVGEKFTYLDKFRKRDEAILFIQDFTLACHHLLITQKSDREKYSRHLVLAHDTQSALHANGNVRLQLSNFAMKLVD